MTASPQRAALDAVHSARHIVARLSTSSDKEDLAADIIEAWSAVESGLRSLIGGSVLTGPALIRELRQRQFLSLDQANALAEFHAARERAGHTDYSPTDADINATRGAFLKLESGLMGDPPSGALPITRGMVADGAPSVAATRLEVPLADPSPRYDASIAQRNRRPSWLVPVAGAVLLLVVLAGVWGAVAGRSSSGSYDQGVSAYREGRHEAAEGAFRKAALDAPADPMPHVYLARMERERGNLNNANVEAVKSVELGPTNGAALRELASVLFAQQNFDGARTFYTRAVRADSTDRLSQGYLGCSLVRLGRVTEGQRWIDRAGTGTWTACAPPPTPAGSAALPMRRP